MGIPIIFCQALMTIIMCHIHAGACCGFVRYHRKRYNTSQIFDRAHVNGSPNCLLLCLKYPASCSAVNLYFSEQRAAFTCDLLPEVADTITDGHLLPNPTGMLAVRNGTGTTFQDCRSVMSAGQTTSGIAKIYPDAGVGQQPFTVFCDMSTAGGGWTVLLRRQDGSISFARPWNDYRNGFGDRSGEFYAGNDVIHKLTSSGTTYRLRVDLVSYAGEYRYAEYDTFRIEGETAKFRLHIGQYSGNATDSFSGHNTHQFSTPDQDNDMADYSCAATNQSGWWYHGCSSARLTGLYGENVPDPIILGTSYRQGIMWSTWLGFDEHPKFVEMKIRPI